MPCAAVSREMASPAGASALQQGQMKVGRKGGQPLFEGALLKPQRQEGPGMVAQDLLSQLSPCPEPASPARPGTGAVPGPATSPSQPPSERAELCPIHPGREIINREETANIPPALLSSGRLRGQGSDSFSCPAIPGMLPQVPQPSRGCFPGTLGMLLQASLPSLGESSPELPTATCGTNLTSWHWDATVGISSWDDNVIGNITKKPYPAFAWGREVEPSIHTPPVLRACDNPAAGASCCRWSEAPRTLPRPSSPPEGRGGGNSTRGVPPQQPCQASSARPSPLNSEAVEIMLDHRWLHQSCLDLPPPIAARVTSTLG